MDGNKIEYYVYATNDCNLQCAFCYDQKLDRKVFFEKPQYELKTLVSFIEKTQKLYNSTLADIIFFGGEPTLNTEFINNLINFLDKSLSLIRVGYILHTNGTLLNKVNDTILSRLSVIIISVDYEAIPKSGIADTYFSNIIDSIKCIRQKHKVKFLCRLTISENVSLFTNVMQVSSFFDYVHWQISNCYSFVDYDKFYRNYSYESILLFEHWLKYLTIGTCLNYVPFTGIAKSLMSDSKTDSYCGFNKDCIYVQTDGNCYSCPEAVDDNEFLIGNIYSGIEFGNQNSGHYCEACPFLEICKGRCGRMHVLFDDVQIKKYCKLNEGLFVDIFKNKNKILELITRHSLQNAVNDEVFRYTEVIP